MKKVIIGVSIFCWLLFGCSNQKFISYNFDHNVVDSLKNGIQFYENFLKKSAKDMKFFIVLEEKNNGVELYLQEYSHMPKTEFVELIKKSNRLIKVTNSLLIPLIFVSDQHSALIKKEKISMIPLSGYYIKFIYENYTQKVVTTAVLF